MPAKWSANKPLTNCVRTVSPKLSTSLEQAVIDLLCPHFRVSGIDLSHNDVKCGFDLLHEI